MVENSIACKENQTSFITKLFDKLAHVKEISEKTGVNTSAAQKEVIRQIGQVSKTQGGNPINGYGVTKSGKED